MAPHSLWQRKLPHSPPTTPDKHSPANQRPPPISPDRWSVDDPPMPVADQRRCWRDQDRFDWMTYRLRSAIQLLQRGNRSGEKLGEDCVEDCPHWTTDGSIDTGDKDPYTQRAHCEHIVSTDNMLPQCAHWVHFDHIQNLPPNVAKMCAPNLFKICATTVATICPAVTWPVTFKTCPVMWPTCSHSIAPKM